MRGSCRPVEAVVSLRATVAGPGCVVSTIRELLVGAGTRVLHACDDPALDRTGAATVGDG
ncbi:hypothetical protein NI25_29240 [Streptomyces sp. CCM_MD2014]|nr:hypothetical protein NI25_29240 [Streptomyces sp. CCM_MD2014]